MYRLWEIKRAFWRRLILFFVLIQRNIAVHETKTENLDRDEEEINSDFFLCVFRWQIETGV